MSWNPYTDQKNRAYSGIVTSLFPEQTKTIPRIIVWSVVFLMDLILVIGGAFSVGLLNGKADYRLTGGLLFAAVIGLFWLEGKLWYGFLHMLQRRKELD